MVTVNEILDTAILAGGKLPDLFWDIEGISGSELKVLNYVWKNCIRLYTTIKVFPRGVDGSPRFWRGKEQMAADLNMSAPTFRNAVRSLHKLGLVTSMDGCMSDDAVHCIGLSADYVNSFDLDSVKSKVDIATEKSKDFSFCHCTENVFRSALFINFNLLNLLFDYTTVVITLSKVSKLVNSPLDTNVSKLSETEKQHTTNIEDNRVPTTEKTVLVTPPATKNIQQSTQSHTKITKQMNNTREAQADEVDKDQNCSTTRKRKVNKVKVTRQPISHQRKPITQVPGVFIVTSAKNKLELLKNVTTPKEQEILSICEYYEYKCRQAIHSSGFRALGKDFRNHKNWKYLERLHRLCQDNDWNYKVYIDSQFERVKYWNRKQEYPYLNQLFSENAIKCYNNYIKDLKENTSLTGDGKVTHGEIKDINTQIADDVVKDCDKISSYLKLATKRRSTKDMNPAELKMIYLSEHWTGLSTYYLSAIPWFIQYLNQLPEEEFIRDLKSNIHDVQSSKSMLSRVNQIVKTVESEFSIPETMVL